MELVVDETPSDPRARRRRLRRLYDHRRQHEEVCDGTPADVYCGRRDAILAQRNGGKTSPGRTLTMIDTDRGQVHDGAGLGSDEFCPPTGLRDACPTRTRSAASA